MSQYGPGDRPPAVKKRVVKVDHHERRRQQAEAKAHAEAHAEIHAAGPPNFPKAIPVRPGAQTNRYAPKPTTQAQRTHVHTARVNRNKLLQTAAEQRQIVGLQAAMQENAKHPKNVVKIKKPEEHHGALLATAMGAAKLAGPLAEGASKVGSAAVQGASKAAPYLAAGVVPGMAVGNAIIDKVTGSKINKTLAKTLSNAPIDAAELAVTTPSSVAKLASTAVHDPEKVPGLLAQPYKDLYHDPVKFATTHPVTTALMLQPAVKMPGRIVGRIARVAGKQTLERASATLPGTALKETRVGSRDALVNQLQKRADAKAGPRTMSDTQVLRRVDEFFDQSQQQKARVAGSAAKEAKRRFADLPKDERKAAGTEHVKGAKGGARTNADVKFAREFGSTWHVNPEGRIVKPKNATEGVLHESKAHADAVAEQVPFDAIVKPVGEKFAVVPRVALERLNKQKVVGTSQAVGAKVMRTSGKLFRNAVLPLSMKWLAGQGAEAGARSAIAGAGPLSLLRERKVFNKLEADRPGAGVEMRQRTSGGGQFGLTGTAREFADGTKTLGDEFAGHRLGGVAAQLTKAGATAPMKAVRSGWKGYTHVVFNVVNNALETTAQRAMAGKALKNSPLMERHIVGLSDKAITEAAHGLKATESQVELGRQLGRMYGNYSKFSPDKRETLLHTTPFWPWYRNSITFLTKVLPVDHPVLTAALASAGKVEEDWRKAHHLSLRDPNHVSMFMMGGVPTKGGKVQRISRYLPFGAAQDPAQSVADLFYPQFSGTAANLQGIDFTGHRLKYPGYSGREFNEREKVLAALATEAGVLAPGVGQVGRITGAVPKYVFHKDAPASLKPKALLKAANKEVNPAVPTGSGQSAESSGGTKIKAVKIKPVKVKAVKVRPVKIR